MFADKQMDLEEQYDKIYRYCYFKVHNREAAEDITQETFLRFFEQYAHYGTPRTLQYLYKIAHNLCVDEYRKEARRSKREVHMEAAADPPEGMQPGFLCGAGEDGLLTKMAIRDALSALPEEDREILLLRYVNEVPVSTICHLLQISRFALYRRMKKALQVLQNSLGEEEKP